MKRTPLFIILLLMLCACEKHAFDFSRFGGAEGTASWGLPLATAEYSTCDLINLVDNHEIVQTNADGTLDLLAEVAIEDFLVADRFMHFECPARTATQSFPLPSARAALDISIPVTLPLENDDVALASAVVKTGRAVVSIAHNIPASMGGDLTYTLHSDQVLTAANAPLDITISSPTQCALDLSGCTILPNGSNEVQLSVRIAGDITFQDAHLTDSQQQSPIFASYPMQTSCPVSPDSY